MYGIYDGGVLIAKFVAPMAVRSNHPVFTTDTLSLSRLISRRTAQRWEIETRLEPLSNSAQDLFVHLVTKGYSSTFTILTPQNYGALQARTSTSTPTTTGTANANASIAVIATGTNTGLIPKGTFFKFSNPGHSKVYMTTANITDSTPGQTINFYPPLKTSVPTGTTIIFKDDVQMTCYYDTDVISGMVYTDGILMDIGQIRIVEAV